MASIRFRGNKWQARVSRKGEQSPVKTFQSKEDAERWAKNIMFRYLTEIGNRSEMLYKEIITQGRPPSGYEQLDLTDPKN